MTTLRIIGSIVACILMAYGSAEKPIQPPASFEAASQPDNLAANELPPAQAEPDATASIDSTDAAVVSELESLRRQLAERDATIADLEAQVSRLSMNVVQVQAKPAKQPEPVRYSHPVQQAYSSCSGGNCGPSGFRPVRRIFGRR